MFIMCDKHCFAVDWIGVITDMATDGISKYFHFLGKNSYSLLFGCIYSEIWPFKINLFTV